MVRTACSFILPPYAAYSNHDCYCLQPVSVEMCRDSIPALGLAFGRTGLLSPRSGDTPHLGVGAENSGFGVGYRARAWCRDQSPGPLAKA